MQVWCGVNILCIMTSFYKHVQKRLAQIRVCSLGIQCIRWIAACLTRTTSHNDLSSTPVIYKGSIHTDRPSSLTDKIEQVILLAHQPGMNLWTTAPEASFTCERMLQQAPFCPTNKPPCAFNLFLTSKRNRE